MPLPPGTRLGPYEITGWIGAGGMGEVYRAHDRRLDRDVAVKLIAGPTPTDPERVRRFEQEARAASRLTHPNVLSVFDVGTHDGMPYIVSEVVEGESLGRLLAAGPMVPARAVAYARQMAEGLAAAHDSGIVHRDLKPDNLVVSREGRLTILDFGIAKLIRPSDDQDSRAKAAGDTEPARVWGTVRYMSPEQVRGEVVDARSDLFSLGTILHEMLTGHAAFGRPTTADTLAAILKEEPAGPLPPAASGALRRVVARCLEKSRESRFQSARDLAFALAQVADGSAADGARLPPHRLRWLATLAAAATVATAAVGWWMRGAEPVAAPALRLELALGADSPLAPVNLQFGNAVALSPDGTMLAFVAQATADGEPQLFVRALTALEATPLAGTDRAVAPFFSPDGRWVAFFTRGLLRKVPVAGGPAVTLAEAPNQRGGHWGDDDTIVFAPDRVAGSQVLRIPAAGGSAVPVAALAEGEAVQLWPQLLPGSSTVLFTSSATPGSYAEATIVAQPIAGGPRTVVQTGAFHGIHTPSGHLLFVREGTLFAVPFDHDRLAVSGTPVPVVHGVMSNSVTGGAQVSVAANGTLAYLPGARVGGAIALQWMAPLGPAMPISDPVSWLNARVSPDGTRIVLERREEASDVWVYDVPRGLYTRLTSDPQSNVRPIWSPDGRHVVFAMPGVTGGPANLYAQAANGAGAPIRLTESALAQEPASWHPDGRFLAMVESRSATGMDILALPVERSMATGGWTAGSPIPIVDGPAREWDPEFSPDGKWLAYASAETGRPEVFVRPFPGPGGRWQVSRGGGTTPTWSRTARQLLYAADDQLMALDYRITGGEFRGTAPRPWMTGRHVTRGPNRMYDLHPDGQRVVASAAGDGAAATGRTSVVLILNFFDELRRLAAVER
ncbi:MAG: protein kinase [Vicinamibacterales bacterium]